MFLKIFKANSIGIITLTNSSGQNLLHLAAKYGAINCLLFILEFKNIDPNKKDINDKLPLDYLLENFNHFNGDNREMFLSLAKKTNYDVLSGINMLTRLNSWQITDYENHIERKNVNMICS